MHTKNDRAPLHCETDFSGAERVATDEPPSPDSPIGNFVRRSSKNTGAKRPNACTVHTSATKYLFKLMQRNSPKSQSVTFTPIFAESDAPDFDRPLQPVEARNKDKRAVRWFREARHVNSVIPTMPGGGFRKQWAKAEDTRMNTRMNTKESRRVSKLEASNVDLQSPTHTKLPPEARERLQEVFKTYDKDKSGSIDLTELHDMCNELGAKITKEQAQDLMTELDTDGNGIIDFEEFVNFWCMHPSLGKYRSVKANRRSSGMHALMGGVLDTLAPAITQNNLLKRLSVRAQTA
eukprot:gnl/MRDRNA2_/MRDRNA2_238572_c0_seq1.p1 gnl/MRDRNA2_/MRDRNA2_238572_c0~~gnl/MRDRNA2_/MRDRNA2_238572_c0_seq1.p1  ORF type:complete len:292 (-),score=62.73 gnl/MRDRNA2_/MRDRNA2_238572_c0_seq1:12-887(-)